MWGRLGCGYMGWRRVNGGTCGVHMLGFCCRERFLLMMFVHRWTNLLIVLYSLYIECVDFDSVS